MKILTVVGARPQFIKAATVSRAIASITGLTEKIIHTGQHFDPNMSDVFFQEMEIPKPAYHLDIHGVNHGAMTGRMLEKIEEILLQEKPDVVLVYGDTNSTLAGALAASKLHYPLVHVEAGLRSFNMRMPEEINRILTDRVSNVLCCPTDQAVKNLVAEGYDKLNVKIENTGDVMLDAVQYYFQKSANKGSILKDVGLEKGEYILVTVHRAENTDELNRLKQIVDTLNEINQTIPIVYPIHPRTRKIIEKNQITVHFKVIDPVGYFDMLQLIEGSKFVMTDSGGLQKEAYFFAKPCITLREETEWVELVESKTNLLTGANKDKILDAVNVFSHNACNFEKKMYGDGYAALKIVGLVR